MGNFERLAAQGAARFLRSDPAAAARRRGLAADGNAILLPFCGELLRIDRQDGSVTGPDGGPAGPAAALSAYDFLCFSAEPVQLTGRWCGTAALPGAGQSSPDEDRLNRPRTARLERDPAAVEAACRAMGGRPFPVGDAAAELPIFPGFPAVFQLFLGDEEFPSVTRFLWDEAALRCLHFETLYYIMDCVLSRILRLADL